MGRTKVDNTYVHTIYKDGKPVIFNEEYFEPLSEIFDDLMPVDDPKIKEADENTAKGSICYYYKKNVGENPNFDILNKFFEQKYKDGYHFNNEIKDVDQELTLKIKPRGIND